MERKILVVWNPFSGGRSEKVITKLRQILQTDKLPHAVIDTRLTKSAELSVSRELDHTFTDLIVVGGDGTINEAINGMNHNVPVGIIPAGTGNDFVKNIPIGTSLQEQIQTALHGAIRPIDLGQCNNRKFANGVGIGFDGQIVEDMAAKRVPLLSGHLAYYYHVLRILGGYRERQFTYWVDGQPAKKELILLTVGNGTTFGGGFKLMPHARVDDGQLEVCEIGKISGFRRFLNVSKLSNGTHEALNEVNIYKAKAVRVEGNKELFAHIDGERMGQPPFNIVVLPKALLLRVRKA